MFLDEILPDYYEVIGPEHRHSNTPGQICYTPILYTHENREVWRPVGYDDTRTSARAFEITAVGQDAYRRNTPLAIPKLETNEEFPLLRAKTRPVILVTPAPSNIPIRQLPGGARLNWPLAIVIPCTSTARKDGTSKYRSEFIERVRRLEFPEVFFLPKEPGTLNADSLLSVYRLTNVFQPHLEPTDRKLTDPILEILRGQIRFYLSGQYLGDYQAAREMLLNP